MYILSLETSTRNFSLAVSKDEKVLRSRNIRTDKILESSMIGAIEKILGFCDLTFEQVDALVVGLGPGSFTSLRVGLSTVKAFALATKKKLVGVCSLDVIASGVVGAKVDEICVLVDARREKVYAAIYDKNLSLKSEYMLTSIDDVLKLVQGKTLFVGDGIPLYKKHIEQAYRSHSKEKANGCQPVFASEKFWYPQAKELAKLGGRRLQKKDFDDPAMILPIYLYPQDCQVNRS